MEVDKQAQEDLDVRVDFGNAFADRCEHPHDLRRVVPHAELMQSPADWLQPASPGEADAVTLEEVTDRCAHRRVLGLAESVEPDLDGPDLDNLNDEYVDIENSGDSDLTGWSVRDESSSHRDEFVSGFGLGRCRFRNPRKAARPRWVIPPHPENRSIRRGMS